MMQTIYAGHQGLLEILFFKQMQQFNGYFSENSHFASIPNSLLFFLHMLSGTSSDINEQAENDEYSFQPALSIAQLIVFNSANQRYDADKEMPLGIYVAFLLHSQTRLTDFTKLIYVYDSNECSHYLHLFLTVFVNNTRKVWFVLTISNSSSPPML